MKCAGGFLLLSCLAVFAQDARDCAAIDDTDERLACFDRVFPGADASESDREKKRAAAEEAPVSSDVAESVQTKPIEAPEQPADPSTEQAPTQPGKRGMFDREDVEIASTITDLLRRDQQKMVFQLANGEIWIQSTPRTLPIHVGDAVTIRNARFFGGYILRTENGVTTRVQRIQ